MQGWFIAECFENDQSFYDINYGGSDGTVIAISRTNDWGVASKCIEQLKLIPTLAECVNESYERARDKGFHEGPVNIGEKIALMHSELSEALEWSRTWEKNLPFTGIVYLEKDPTKPDGFAVELVDCMIRIFDLCGRMGIDIEKVYRAKSDYNEGRPYKHGKRF